MGFFRCFFFFVWWVFYCQPCLEVDAQPDGDLLVYVGIGRHQHVLVVAGRGGRHGKAVGQPGQAYHLLLLLMMVVGVHPKLGKGGMLVLRLPRDMIDVIAAELGRVHPLPAGRQPLLLQGVGPVGRLGVVVDEVFAAPHGVAHRPAGGQGQVRLLRARIVGHGGVASGQQLHQASIGRMLLRMQLLLLKL